MREFGPFQVFYRSGGSRSKCLAGNVGVVSGIFCPKNDQHADMSARCRRHGLCRVADMAPTCRHVGRFGGGEIPDTTPTLPAKFTTMVPTVHTFNSYIGYFLSHCCQKLFWDARTQCYLHTYSRVQFYLRTLHTDGLHSKIRE